jgi:carboxymethylenebutenolidase
MTKSLFAVLAVGLVVSCGGSADEAHVRRMAAEHRGDTPVPGAAAHMAPSAPVTSADVAYATVSGTQVEGTLVHPEGKGPWPGVIMIHEWWGLNQNIRVMAESLASNGFTVLAVDLYSGAVADTPERARELMSEVMKDPDRAEDNLRQAYAYLASHEHAPKVGVVGWCFGGGWSLRTALMLPDKIGATVIYYGQLVTDPARLKTLDMPIMGFFGAEDQGIPVSEVKRFQAALEELHKNAQIIIYPGAGHAFANPSGTRYVESAAQDSWRRTVAFFRRYLQ